MIGINLFNCAGITLVILIAKPTITKEFVMDERLIIDEVWIDCREDEVLLVKKIEALLEKIRANKERIVCVICDEERTMLKLRRE